MQNHMRCRSMSDFPYPYTTIAMSGPQVPMPPPPDYPDCLKHLLRRKIWRTTLGEFSAALENGGFGGKNVFVKPGSDIKAFNGVIEPKDQMLWYYFTKYASRNLTPKKNFGDPLCKNGQYFSAEPPRPKLSCPQQQIKVHL